MAIRCTASVIRAIPSPCVQPHLHRRRSGVRVLAGQPHFKPPKTLPVRHHADILALGFQNWSLFDVQFEEGVHLPCTDLFIPLPADALQFITELLAGRILAIIGPVQFVHARKNPRSQHGRGKSGTFFVRPVRHNDRMFRPDVQIVQSPDNLQSAKDTQNPVVFAARRLRVQMGTHVDLATHLDRCPHDERTWYPSCRRPWCSQPPRTRI